MDYEHEITSVLSSPLTVLLSVVYHRHHYAQRDEGEDRDISPSPPLLDFILVSCEFVYIDFVVALRNKIFYSATGLTTVVATIEKYFFSSLSLSLLRSLPFLPPFWREKNNNLGDLNRQNRALNFVSGSQEVLP